MDKVETSRTATPTETVGALEDARLLECFAARQDEAAFAALVRRYGPLVLGVCRRVLGHEQDAEDAFQATFLVLARKASSIRRRGAVGSWLYGVAYRIARKAKAGKERRPVSQSELPDVPAPEGSPEWAGRDLAPVVDEEVSRLPAVYRQPFILCYLEGKTNEQAARQLGCPLGTVLSRLARARDRLRTRLARRGLALSAAALAGALTGHATAAVPAGLAAATLRAAVEFAGGTPGSGAVPASAAALAQGYLRGLFRARLVAAAACLLALVLGALAVVLLLPAEQPPAPPPTARAAATPEADRERLQGAWQVVALEFAGQPLPTEGMQVVFTGDRCAVLNQGKPGVAKTYALDPSRDPKMIDMVSDLGVSTPGIYALDGDTLKICLGESADRPSEFVTEPGVDTLLFILRRKPGAPGP